MVWGNYVLVNCLTTLATLIGLFWCLAAGPKSKNVFVPILMMLCGVVANAVVQLSILFILFMTR